jgi:hypothetical protein
MKLDDVLLYINSKNPQIKKAMKNAKGGKVEKKIPIEGNKIFGKNFHSGYSYKVDNSDKDQWPGLGTDNGSYVGVDV